MAKRIIEFIIGLLFIVSAIAKLYDFSNTINLIISITSFSFTTIKIGLLLLSFAEIVIGIVFIFNKWQKPAMFYSILSLIVFFILLNLFFFFKGYSNCGCYGTQIVSSPLVSFVKNVIIAAYLIYAKYSFKKISVVL